MLALLVVAAASVDLLAEADQLRKAGDNAGAAAACARAAAAAPLQAEPRFLWGMTERSLGHTDAAISQYRAALSLSPRFAEAHMNLASLLGTAAGREAEALHHYEEALSLKSWPTTLVAQVEHNIAVCMLELGRDEAAVVQHLRRAVERDPSFAAAVELLRELEAADPAEPPPAEAEPETADRSSDRCAWGAADHGGAGDGARAAGTARERASFRTDAAIAALREALQDDLGRPDPPEWQRVARWSSVVLAEFAAVLAEQGSAEQDPTLLEVPVV